MKCSAEGEKKAGRERPDVASTAGPASSAHTAPAGAFRIPTARTADGSWAGDVRAVLLGRNRHCFPALLEDCATFLPHNGNFPLELQGSDLALFTVLAEVFLEYRAWNVSKHLCLYPSKITPQNKDNSSPQIGRYKPGGPDFENHSANCKFSLNSALLTWLFSVSWGIVCR